MSGLIKKATQLVKSFKEDLKIIKLIKGLIKHFKKDEPAKSTDIQPVIIPRQEHSISRQAINPNALKVLYRLHNAGYSAYLVGGCVRDLLLGKHPKDFDIATNAHPEEIRRLFKNCRLIGKRFRLAHIVFGREIIEVATFRTHHTNAGEQHGHMHKGMIVRDNVYGSIEDDVYRRDFTINALYYNIADFSVVDYVAGMHDIEAKVLRMIGEPEKRFHEDPVRLLRVVRFAGKLSLSISPETEKPIIELSYLLGHVSSARLYQEVLKLFQSSGLHNTFHLLQKYKLFEQLFPQTAAMLTQPLTASLIERALRSTDQRLQEEKTVSTAFLFAIFLWHPIKAEAEREELAGMPTYVAFEKAIHSVLKAQTAKLAIPRQLQINIRDICFLQHRFTQRHGARPFRVLEHQRYRAGYDLLVLRSEAGEPVLELHEWWTLFHDASPEKREKMIREAGKSRPKKRKRSRKFSKKHSSKKHGFTERNIT